MSTDRLSIIIMPQCQDSSRLGDGEHHIDEKEQKQFLQGFKFIVKYIGTMEVPRPISRLEIVSAMRRIRYDFKTRSVKKRYVEMSVSLSGVHVYLQSKNKLKKSAPETCHSSPNPILRNPIHRIFYVSHDSKDTKIFSYIAKEEETNVFRCSVFKALKKCQAGEIVKTIGQAFEVSHMAHQLKRSAIRDSEKNQSDADSLLSLPPCPAQDETEAHNSLTCRESSIWSPPQEQNTYNEEECDLDTHQDASESSTSEGHQRAVMKQKLKIRCQEITFLKSQNKLLQRQLEVEMQARKQAETSTQLLISQNQELLCQVDVLLKKLSKYEKTLLMKSKNLDLATSCPVHSCLFTEEREKNEMKNSPDSGLNETSAEGSQNEEWTGGPGGPGGPGVDNEAATSTPEKEVNSNSNNNNNNNNSNNNNCYPCSPDGEAQGPSWKHKSKVSQFFAGRSKPLLAASNKRGSTNAEGQHCAKRSDSNCSAKKFLAKEKHHHQVSPGDSCTHVTDARSPNDNDLNEIHLKTPNQSKSCKKFKLEKMIAIRKNLGDSTTELELSFGD